MKHLLIIVLALSTSFTFGQSSKNRLSIDLLNTGEAKLTTAWMEEVLEFDEADYLFLRVNYERLFSERNSLIVSSNIRKGSLLAPFMGEEITGTGEGLDIEFMIMQRKYFKSNRKTLFYRGIYVTTNFLRDELVLTGVEDGVSFEMNVVDTQSQYYGGGLSFGVQRIFFKHIFIELEAGLGAGFEPEGLYEDQSQITGGISTLMLENWISHQLIFTMKPSFLNLNVGLAF